LRAVLDTSVLIGDAAPDGVEAAISVISIAELHFGVLVAGDMMSAVCEFSGSARSSPPSIRRR
jgi:hypothetical protein